MASEVADQIQETTGSIGTGTITLIEKAGFARFSDAFAAGERVFYAIKNGNNWETGRGTIGATANTLERTTVYSTYVSGTLDDTSPIAITLSGTSTVGVVNPASNISDPAFDSVTVNGAITAESQIIDSTGTEALLVRKDADGGDVLAVDTTNSEVDVTGDLTVSQQILVDAGGSFTGNLAIEFTGADTGTGFYQNGGSRIDWYMGNTFRWIMSSSSFSSPQVHGANLLNINGSITAPIYRSSSDTDSGVVFDGADGAGIGVGGITGVLYKEASSHVIVTHQGNYGLTADVGSAQGNGVILSSNNEYSTVANAGDCGTLPTAAAGVEIKVMNNGANSMDVFPASGDDIDGAGVNVAYALAAGGRAIFHASNATDWNVF